MAVQSATQTERHLGQNAGNDTFSGLPLYSVLLSDEPENVSYVSDVSDHAFRG